MLLTLANAIVGFNPFMPKAGVGILETQYEANSQKSFNPFMPKAGVGMVQLGVG